MSTCMIVRVTGRLPPARARGGQIRTRVLAYARRAARPGSTRGPRRPVALPRSVRSTMPAEPPRKLGKDAAENAERVIAAPSGPASRGARRPMAQIAADAGVGIGTLYRRYPTREALLEAMAVGRTPGLARRRTRWCPGREAWTPSVASCADLHPPRRARAPSARGPMTEGTSRRAPGADAADDGGRPGGGATRTARSGRRRRGRGGAVRRDARAADEPRAGWEEAAAEQRACSSAGSPPRVADADPDPRPATLRPMAAASG